MSYSQFRVKILAAEEMESWGAGVSDTVYKNYLLLPREQASLWESIFFMTIKIYGEYCIISPMKKVFPFDDTQSNNSQSSHARFVHKFWLSLHALSMLRGRHSLHRVDRLKDFTIFDTFPSKQKPDKIKSFRRHSRSVCWDKWFMQTTDNLHAFLHIFQKEAVSRYSMK